MQAQDREALTSSRRDLVRKLLFGGVRLVLVPVALVWFISKVAGGATGSAVLSEPCALVLGLLVNQVALAVFAGRMQLVLMLFKVHISWKSALRIHLQSMFYFFALPMTVGLEIARFAKIREIQPSASVLQISSALLLDRLLGALSALAVALLCLPFVNANMDVVKPGWGWILAPVLAFVGGVGALLWPRSRRMISDACRLARGRLVALAGLFALSMSMHMVFAAGVYLVAVGLALALSPLDLMLAIAGGMLLVAVPVSFAGLGPAEAGAAGLLLALGYAPAVAVVAGALPYLARLVGALEGAAWEFLESGSATIAVTRRLMAQASWRSCRKTRRRFEPE